MVANVLWHFSPDASIVADRSAEAPRFNLTRYFLITSLIALAIISPLLYFSEHSEELFFEDVQKEQIIFFGEVEAEFSLTQKLAAQDVVLRMNEVSHVNLTHVFANMLWDDVLSPLVKRAQSIPITHCRALTVSAGTILGEAQLANQKMCFAEVGKLIISLPGFGKLDAAVRATMRRSSVFKIKVFDLRGLTVYSSEHQQIGEDKSNNQGWRTAASGLNSSELTHRDKFSAFESVVENRDLISSYIPIFSADNQVLGVFEIYSDATLFLKGIQATSAKQAERASINRKAVELVANKNLDRLSLNNWHSQLMGWGLLVCIYLLLLMIVRNGQRILDLQRLEQTRVGERERQWHREKMMVLSTMAANVSHEVGNPLATISALAEDIAVEKSLHACTICQPKAILAQTERIVSMTRQIVNFAMIRGDIFEPIDVNQMVKEVCDFLSFDHRFRAIKIEMRLAERLPAPVVISDHLNEALMSLLQGCLETNLKEKSLAHRIQVETDAQDDQVLIRIIFDATPNAQAHAEPVEIADTRVEWARQRILGLGGQLVSTPRKIEISLTSPSPLIATI